MFEELSPTDLLERRENGEAWQLLDVREPREIELAHIDGTLNIPMAQVPGRLGELDREAPIAVLCHSGGRSARIAALLVQAGFSRVANVTGGIDAWAVEIDQSIPRY